MLNRGYQTLTIDFSITEELQEAIDAFMNHINHENGLSEDCYRSEILFWLKDAEKKLSREQFESLKQYYVLGGIYKFLGYPWEFDKAHMNTSLEDWFNGQNR